MMAIARWLKNFCRSEIRCVMRANAQLGENPRWSITHKRLYWIDPPSGTVHFFEPTNGRSSFARIAPEVGVLLQHHSGKLMVGLQDGIWELSADLVLGEQLAKVTGLRPECRLNDGAIDAADRIWLATMHREGTEKKGGVCRLDPDGTTTWVDEGYLIANGPALDPGGSGLYVADSPRRQIYRLDLDVDGNCIGKRLFTQFDKADGYPDGMVLCPDGYLWVAHYDGGCVTKFSPEGFRLESIRLPVTKATACTFGGEALATLFITSASQGLDPDERRHQPLAGGLFAHQRAD